MCTHEIRDFPSEIHYEYEKEKYRHHEHSTVCTCPLCECRIVSAEIFGLKYCEATDDEYEEHSEDARLRYTEECIGRHGFAESFLEHLERREEDDEKSDPLYAWVFFEKSGDITRCYHHEDDRDDESDHEIHDISVAGSCYRENIVETHSDIGYDDRLDCRGECCCRILASFFMVFVCTDLSVELPYHVEEEYRSEEFETRNLEEKYDSEWEDDTKNGCTSNSPKYCLLSHLWGEIFGCHPDKDSIISAHDEVDEDDIEECKSSCRCK